MSLLGDFLNAAAGVVETVVDAGEDVVESVGDGVADFVETAGNAVQNGTGHVANAGRDIPGVGPAIDVAFTWLGGVVAGATNVAGAVIKGVLGIVAGVVGGLLKVAFGILLLNSGLIFGGILDIGSSVLGAVVVVLGTIGSLLQRLVFVLQSPDRPLNKEEADALRLVFQSSLELYNIRIIEGSAGLFSVPALLTADDRPFTLGNTIYMKGVTRRSVLIHEAVHVWQYQNVGTRYASDALVAGGVFGPDAYDWEKEIEKGREEWVVFNAEAQAELMEDIWDTGSVTSSLGATTTGNGVFYEEPGGNDVQLFLFNTTDHTKLAIDGIAALRGKLNVRRGDTPMCSSETDRRLRSRSRSSR